MDFDLGEQATALRSRLRELIATHIAEDYLGAFTNDPADLEVAQRFCKTLADAGLLTIAWPVEYGGGGGSVWDQTVVREEMWAHHEPRGAQYMGLNWVGPAIMAFGTEEQKQQHLGRDRRRGGHLVPGLQRARGRLGPRLPAHARHRGRRRLAHQRPEDLDVLRRHGPVVRPGGAGRAGRAPRGHHDVPRPDGRAGHHRAAHPLDARPPPPQRGVLRRRARRPRRGARRHRRGLGRHPQGAGPRARGHRPLRPLRAPAVGGRRGAGPALGRAPRVAARRSGPGRSCTCGWPACSPTGPSTPRPPASCPTCTPRRRASP